MTSLTADAMRPHKGRDLNPWQYDCVGYTDMQGGSVAYTIYKGEPVYIDVSDVDGYAQPWRKTASAAGGDVFLGIAIEQVSVAAANTAQGDKQITVARSGVWAFPVASCTVTDIGGAAYMSDSNVVTVTSTNNLWVGYIVDADAVYVWVDISKAAGRVCAAT
jgi:predicted RecA/RadA family phage recombinase